MTDKTELDLIVDRIEEGIAICENRNREHVNIHLSDISGVVHEGDVLRHDAKKGTYFVDAETTAQRRKKIFQIQKAIFKGGR